MNVNKAGLECEACKGKSCVVHIAITMDNDVLMFFRCGACGNERVLKNIQRAPEPLASFLRTKAYSCDAQEMIEISKQLSKLQDSMDDFYL